VRDRVRDVIGVLCAWGWYRLERGAMFDNMFMNWADMAGESDG
jgi:hypothetical protein